MSKLKVVKGDVDIEEIYPFTLKSTLIKHNSNL